MAFSTLFSTSINIMANICISLLYFVPGLIGMVTASNSTQSRPKHDEQGDMLRGLAFGFGGFFGFIILLCLLWRCCCSSSNDDLCGSCCRKKQQQQRPIKARLEAGQGRGRPKGIESRSKVSPSPPSSAMSWSRNS